MGHLPGVRPQRKYAACATLDLNVEVRVSRMHACTHTHAHTPAHAHTGLQLSENKVPLWGAFLFLLYHFLL